jgi:S-DNA-T family DNA segregation ATPase FtsK/SpoIIIE
MKVKLTLHRANREPVDLLVTCDVGTTVGGLANYLAAADPTRQRAGSIGGPGGLTLGLVGTSRQVFDGHMPLSESGIHSGSAVSLVRESERFADAGKAAAATLAVVAGPDAGREFPLHSGTNVVGRERGCEVRLADPLASRRHARVNVSDVVEIVDLGSANGVLMGNAPVPRALLTPGDQVTVGDTTFTVRLNAGARPEQAAHAVAATAFIRSPRVEPVFGGEKFEVPDLPERPGHQRFPLIALLAPIIMGAGMWLITQNLMSIAFIALSPLMMIGSFAEQRWAGRAAYKKALQEFWGDVSSIVTDAEAMAGQEVAARLREHPSTGDVLAAARDLSPLLWCRRPGEAGHGEVRFGLGEQPSRSLIVLPDGKRAPRDVFGELKQKVAHLATVNGVPVVGAPLSVGALGVAGPRSAALGVARALVAQLATLHSPAELVITSVGSGRAAREWDWLKWLPHTSSPHSPISVNHLASASAPVGQLLSELEAVVAERGGENAGQDSPPATPTILVIIEGDAPAEFGRLVSIAESGWRYGVVVLWVSPAVTQLPAACQTFVAVDGSGNSRVGYVRSGDLVSPVVVDPLDADTALALARRLAPITDIGAPVDDASDLPRSVAFLELAGRGLATDAEAVLERWGENQSILSGPRAPRDASGALRPVRKAGTLRAVVGQSAGGAHALDLRTDGPHALVGGTTGSGKSELLQAWILAMAASHSPERLTFLLVDYKGGAAFAECADLPHTVGLVTDLNTHLVRRALTSLSAELRYRERVLERHEAKDLVSLEKKGVLGAPPSLVIVVDEFAALVSEVPEFVEGMVNVAQRGRSLGLHLILATQRPAGVIKDNLRANTNLRLALRVADEDDSRDVLGSPEAAFFDPNLPGRAVSKTGPGRLVPFQTAYAGARTGVTAPPPQIDVAELSFGSHLVWELEEADRAVDGDPVAQDIIRVVSSIRAAQEVAELPTPRKPWLPELRKHYNLADRVQVPNERRDDALVFGLLDEPEAQAQLPVAFYPDREGNLAVYGAGGSGKSTLLRSLAVAAGMTVHGGPCHVYGLDFSSRGLAMLEDLPHVGSIVSGQDHERVARLLRWLRGLIDERALRYSKVDAATITAYRAIATVPDEPRILLLVDGIPAFRSAYEAGDRVKWFDTFLSIAADGRPVGVHVVITSDQRAGVPPALASAIQRRIVLRMASADDYGMLDVPSDILSSDSPQGRGIYDGREVQVAVLGEASDAQGQAINLRRFAGSMVRAGVRPAPAVLSLAEKVNLADLPVVPGRLVIGIDSELLSPFVTDGQGTFTIVGPPGSGRTTAMITLAQAVRRGRPDARLILLTDRRSELVPALAWAETAIGIDEVADWARGYAASPPSGPVALFVESAGELAGSMADMDLESAVKAVLRNSGVVVSEAESGSIPSPMGLWGALRVSRRGVALQPDQGDGSTWFKTTFPRVTRADFIEGRGYVADKGRAHLVQMALPQR